MRKKRMKYATMFAGLMLMLAATGCATTPTNDYCLIASEIRPTSADVDVISDALVEQLLVHNEIYATLCK
ncbi:Rz-like spanin [Idiomarinaceae phage Phi1M2-2]|uniref:Rz-like spanin n=1 Tax=Idiomarinaceae phage Phi1M2-2 TaxID=1527515 RepID=UPI0004F62B50|nr:Rz-like spanin [Idiomarinaceae phage Phi1M2-2]AIM40794.1 putative Rz-1-like protein [Idiomarinaceae phage Phi1M2-2]